jgi:hypothetical protein
LKNDDDLIIICYENKKGKTTNIETWGIRKHKPCSLGHAT